MNATMPCSVGCTLSGHAGLRSNLLRFSGLRNPHDGKLGVVQEGALADLLLVNGDPIANLKLIENPAQNFLVIMGDGTMHKNMVA
jgi:hypothetical protein